MGDIHGCMGETYAIPRRAAPPAWRAAPSERSSTACWPRPQGGERQLRCLITNSLTAVVPNDAEIPARLRASLGRVNRRYRNWKRRGGCELHRIGRAVAVGRAGIVR
jgi:hypothetical protein